MIIPLLLLASAQALAEKRVALVIGNGNYGRTIGALSNPPKDAALMVKTLRQVGFDVIESIDADQKTMKRAISDFGKKLNEAGKNAVGLFYYAGHGVQVNGINYLIPLKANIDNEADVNIEAVAADGVQAQMAYARNRLNIIVMDACRNNPFKRGFRSVSRGLARMSATRGTLIAYATAPGDVAADGTDENSPYTKALSKAMLTPGLTVERMFKQVRNDVVVATNEKQTPWESSSLTGADFYFKGGPVVAKVPDPPKLHEQADVVAWQSIRNSSNPAEVEAFIQAFKDSPFVGMAEARLQDMRKQQQPGNIESDKPSLPDEAKPKPSAPADQSASLSGLDRSKGHAVCDQKSNGGWKCDGPLQMISSGKKNLESALNQSGCKEGHKVGVSGKWQVFQCFQDLGKRDILKKYSILN